jgi:quinol monooxygenase YgiN
VFARVSTFQGDPKETDNSVQTVWNEIVPKIPKFKGCMGFYYLVDRNSGKSIGITLWETREALDESKRAADENRNQTADKAGGEIISVEQFEIAISELV